MHKAAVKFAGVSPEMSAVGNPAWSFDGVLRRVLGLSRAVELGRNDSAMDALRIFARTLDVQVLRKLETLMQAGRNAEPLGPTSAALSDGASSVSKKSNDLFDDRLSSLENLRRGHAMACATRFDLESEVTGWATLPERNSLDERVWLRFGKELASSSPSDWACLATIGRGTELDALYLRRGEKSWWSFDSVIDRPSTRAVAHRLGAPTRQRGRLVTLPIEAVIGRRCRADRQALRRAAMAMSARLGVCRGA
jgi:hypothetical protein